MASKLLEAALRRDLVVIAAGIATVLGLAWIWLLLGAGTDMNAIAVKRMAGMDGWLMQPAQWSAGYALVMFSMWWVMMVAMMLPSATPMLLLFARVNRKDKADAPAPIPTGFFAAGYLLVWGGFSAVAVAFQWGLESARLLSPMMMATNVWIAAGILIAAGLWQLTPIKAVCLRQCRTPLSFLIGNWRAGNLGAFRMGLEHGGWCLGCCWFLMTLLFFGGVMNLYWVVGLAVYVLVEKIVPFGHWLGRASGIALAAWGALLLLA